MAVTRTNVDFAKKILADRVGNDYVYGGNWRPDDTSVGTDCSGLVIDICDAVRNGTRMAWTRRGMSTESWRPIEVGDTGTIFNTVCVADPSHFPDDAAVKIAIHHGPGGGANSHMWCEVDGVRGESNGSDGCVTGERARSVYDTRYANDWHYIPGPITGAVTQPVNNAVDILARATGLSNARANEILPAITAGLKASDCTNANRIAMWLAQIGHESGSFQYTEEIAKNGRYAPYIGRTWIQITWESNYRQFSQWCYDRGLVNSPTHFVDFPVALRDLQWAGLGAAWYWTVARTDINSLSDARDLLTVTRRINGGTNGLADRQDRYDRASNVGNDLLALVNTTSNDTGNNTADEWETLMALEVESLSIYATPGEKPIPLSRMLQAVDAHGNHEEYVEKQAHLGDADALGRVARTAAGKGKYGAAPFAVNQAKSVLADIERTNPELLRNYLKG